MLATAACASASQSPNPLDPLEAARTARAETGAHDPAEVRFEWEYGDPKGRLRGDGVGRVNPPDSFRLDFFSVAEGSMSAALVEGRLTTLGQIEDITLPDPPFLYAMAGVFRPGPGAPTSGYVDGDTEVLAYGPEEEGTRYFFREDRLVRVEERRRGRVSRRIELEWEPGDAWPRKAEYRDNLTPSRARWEVTEVRRMDTTHPREIYELGTPR